MFKTRKLEPQPSYRKTKPYFPIDNQYAQVKNHYAIYSKTILHQIDSQLELGVIKKQGLLEKCNEVLNAIKKCDHLSRCEVLVKLLGLYRRQRIRVPGEIYQWVEEVIGFLVGVSSRDERKLCELVLMQRIDESLIFIVKSFPDKKKHLATKIAPIIKKFNEVKQRIGKMLPKKENQVFIASLSYWILNSSSKSQQEQEPIKRVKQERPSNISNHSVHSRTSEPPQIYEERLRKFDQTRQNEQFRRNLQMLSQNKKKKIFRRSNSIISINAKRVSTTWGRQEPANMGNSKEIIRKNEGGGPSKFTNTPRKSIFLYENLDLEMYQNCFNKEVVRLATESADVFRPFYFFTIIKDNMRLIIVKKAEIVKETGKLKIHLDGYFKYHLLFHKFHSSLSQALDSEKIKKFLLAHTKLKQRKMWHILLPTLKILPQSEQQNKNIISQLLFETQKFIFYSFIKKLNSFFFAKYSAPSQKSSKGNLTIFNANLQEEVQDLEVSNWNKKEAFCFEEEEQQEEGTKSGKLETTCMGNFIVSEFNLKMRQEVKGRGSMKSRRMGQKFKRKPERKNELFHTVKKEGKYMVISQCHNRDQIFCSNLPSEARYRNLLLLKASLKCMSPKQTFTNRLTRRTQTETLSILNRRSISPSPTRLQSQLNFVTKVVELGYIACRIFIFRPEQSGLVLAEAYVHQLQKYYVFQLGDGKFVTRERAKGDWLAYARKAMKIKVVENGRARHGRCRLVLQIGDIVVEGQQLLYRKCESDSNCNPEFIDSVIIANQSPADRPHPLSLHRQIQKMSSNLENKKSQSLVLPIEDITKKYSQYSEFLSLVREELKKIRPAREIFRKSKNVHTFVNGFRRDRGCRVNRVQIQGAGLRIVGLDSGADERKQCSVRFCDSNFGLWASMAEGPERNRRGLIKFIGRFMRDPLLYRILFKQANSQQ